VPPETGMRVAGTYHWRWAPSMSGQMKSPDATFTVRYADSQLRATINPPAWDDPGYGEYVLIPKKADRYVLGRVNHGDVIEIMEAMAMHFMTAQDHADSLEVRDTDEVLVASGKVAP